MKKVSQPASSHLFNRVAGVVMGLMLLFGYTTRDKWILGFQETQKYFTEGYTGGSIDTRWELYNIAWQAFLEHPWIGSGAGTAKAVIAKSINAQALESFNHFHHLFLQMLSDTGLLGTLIFIAALYFIQKAINQFTAKQGPAIRLSGYTALLTAIFYGITNLSFGNLLFHIFFAYLLALITCSSKTTAEQVN